MQSIPEIVKDAKILMNEKITLTDTLPEDAKGKRLDVVLSSLFKQYSRSCIQTWIAAGFVLVDNQVQQQRYKVKGGESIKIDAMMTTTRSHEAEVGQLNIIFEDDDLIVIDKPEGLVVHPGAGNQQGTLLNHLLHHHPALASIPRAGIVHRIDKDTTGLLVIAKTLTAQTDLVRQLSQHDISREYLALVNGIIIAGDTIEQPIGRHPTQRTKMAVTHNGKPAITHYRIAEKFNAHTLLHVFLETGRTHQIRVHLAHINHAIVGDPVYGGRCKIPAGFSEQDREKILAFKRQALHARKLTLTHPTTQQEMTFTSPIPKDFDDLLNLLRSCS